MQFNVLDLQPHNLKITLVAVTDPFFFFSHEGLIESLEVAVILGSLTGLTRGQLLIGDFRGRLATVFQRSDNLLRGFTIISECFNFFEDDGTVWVEKKFVCFASFDVRFQEKAKETNLLPDNTF